MPLVDNDTFLSEVVDFISQAKSTKNGVNSVYLTYKRHSVVPDSKNDATPSSSAPQQTSSSSSSSSSSSGKRKRSQKSSDSKSNKKVKHWLPKEGEPSKQVCLMHVKLGKKKFSTTLENSNAKEFNENLSTLLRANADGLYKRTTALEQQRAKTKTAKLAKYKATLDRVAKAEAKKMDVDKQ